MNTNFMTGVPDVVGARSDPERQHTSSRINQQIAEQTRKRVEDTVAAGREAIIARLHELDREWSIDRALMGHFALLGGASFALSLRFKPWRIPTALQFAFVLGQAVFGWSPPMPLYRRLGLRTAREIAAERFALVLKLDVVEGAHRAERND